MCASDPYEEQYSVIISIPNGDNKDTYNNILYHVKQIVGVPNPRLFFISKNFRIELKEDFFQNLNLEIGIINIMIE